MPGAEQGAPGRPVAAVGARVPPITGPTSIPGVRRRRLEVAPSELRKVSPLATDGVVNRAMQLLGSVTVQGISDRVAVLWGHRLQKDYSELVSRTLSLSQDDALIRATGHVNRMTAVLASIDLQAVASQPSASGAVRQYFKALNTRVDTPAELNHARVELDQLVGLMGASLEPLLALKEALQKHSARIDDLALDVEAAALAADYLATLLARERPDLSNRFVERAMSLTQTVAQIRSSASLREAQIERPLGLIAAIQNVALVAVPGWLGALAAIVGMQRGSKKPTPTETGELAYRLRTILDQLQA